MRRIPFALIVLRALLGPVMLALAWWWPVEILFIVALSAAFVSDVFDGIIARRLGIATANLRRLDSAADTVFYIGATVAAWHLHPDALRHNFVALLLLLAVELMRYVVDFAKFGREASYHMWSSKLWGVFLFVGFTALLGFGHTGWLVALPIYWGILADVEGLAISLVLPAWRPDVPSLSHALQIRAEKRPM